MRWLIVFWALPLGLFWGWYFLSLNDVHMGYAMFTREAHDQVFDIYSKLLAVVTHEYMGEAVMMAPAEIPGFVARACVIDSALLGGIVAFRRRKAITAWLRERRAVQASPSLPSA